MDPFAAYAPFYDLDYREMEADLLMIEQFAARCGSPILEVGCGTGRLVRLLAGAGYRVTGVDLSAAMLAEAQRKVQTAGLERWVTLVEQDMRHLSLGEQYNLAVLAVNSFMHLLTRADQQAALAGIRHHLKPGGLLLLDLFNPDPARLLELRGQMVLEKVAADPGTGHRLLKFRADMADLGEQTIHVTYIIDDIDGEGVVRRTVFPFSLRYLFRGELELLLGLADFKLEALYGSYDLDEFTGASEKMIAVARRPERD